jgi:hypothetical protein
VSVNEVDVKLWPTGALCSNSGRQVQPTYVHVICDYYIFYKKQINNILVPKTQTDLPTDKKFQILKDAVSSAKATLCRVRQKDDYEVRIEAGKAWRYPGKPRNVTFGVLGKHAEI